MSSFSLLRQTSRATTLRTIAARPIAFTFTSSSNRRTMASFVPPAGKSEWLIIVPDHEGVLAKRMEVRPNTQEQKLTHQGILRAHFAALNEPKTASHMTMGGGILEEPPKEGEPLKLKGSAFTTYATSREEVLEILEADVYTKSGVWDLSKVQIYPFKTAFRKEAAVKQ